MPRLYVNYIDIVSLAGHCPSLFPIYRFCVFRVISNSFFFFSSSLDRVPIGPLSSKSRHPEAVFPGQFHGGQLIMPR